METLSLAVLLIAAAVLGFVLSIRVGILLAVRLDRAIEARAVADKPAHDEEASADE